MNKGKIFIISGPSGSGKTTLYKKLLADPDLRGKLVKGISVTTRPRRTNERNGIDYFFVTPKMFLYKKQTNQFLESMEVFGNYYGTPKKNTVDILKRGKNILLCIDVKGAAVVRRVFPKSIGIFVKTASIKVLQSRLEQRGSETQAIMEKRIETAKKELQHEKHYQHTVINDDLSKAFLKLKQLIKKELQIQDDLV